MLRKEEASGCAQAFDKGEERVFGGFEVVGETVNAQKAFG